MAGEHPSASGPRRSPRRSRRATTAFALLGSLGLHALALFALRHRAELPFAAPRLNLRGLEPVVESPGEPLPSAGTSAGTSADVRELLHAPDTWTAVMPERLDTPLPEPQLVEATDRSDAEPAREPVVTAPAFALADAAPALDFRRAPRRPRVAAPAASMSELTAESVPVGEEAPDVAAAVPSEARDVSGQVAPRALPENTPPDYPEASRRARETGRVVIHALVDETGAVRDVSVSSSSGFPDLDAAAVDAVRSWRFLPATADGIPVAGELDLPFDFVLRER